MPRSRTITVTPSTAKIVKAIKTAMNIYELDDDHEIAPKLRALRAVFEANWASVIDPDADQRLMAAWERAQHVVTWKAGYQQQRRELIPLCRDHGVRY